MSNAVFGDRGSSRDLGDRRSAGSDSGYHPAAIHEMIVGSAESSRIVTRSRTEQEGRV